MKFSSPDKPAVRVDYRITPDKLEIEVRNKGKAFRPNLSACLPVLQDQLPEAGRGIFLIGRLMDELDVECRAGMVVVRMAKRIRPDGQLSL